MQHTFCKVSLLIRNYQEMINTQIYVKAELTALVSLQGKCKMFHMQK